MASTNKRAFVEAFDEEMYPQAKMAKTSVEDRVDRTKPSKTDINQLVMDYLISEGYPLAATRFASEANIQRPSGEMDHMQERLEIKNAILSGDIQTAIEKINDLNLDILESDDALHFSLLRLQLIELIRTCLATPGSDIIPAITFAQTQLAPRAPTNPEFLADLEKTMALLIFPTDKLSGPLAGLLDTDMRQTIAEKVNEAILHSLGNNNQPKLKRLLRLRAWSERRATELGKDLPPNLDLWTNDGMNMESQDSVMTDSGNTGR